MSSKCRHRGMEDVAHTQCGHNVAACPIFETRIRSRSNKTQFGHKNSRTSKRMNARTKRRGRLPGRQTVRPTTAPGHRRRRPVLSSMSWAQSSGMANCEFCILPVAAIPLQLFRLAFPTRIRHPPSWSISHLARPGHRFGVSPLCRMNDPRAQLLPPFYKSTARKTEIAHTSQAKPFLQKRLLVFRSSFTSQIIRVKGYDSL